MGDEFFELICQRCGAKYSSNIVWNPELFRELQPRHDCLGEAWYFLAPTILKDQSGTTYKNG